MSTRRGKKPSESQEFDPTPSLGKTIQRLRKAYNMSLGDLSETVAIRNAFGAHASRLAVSSTKSMTGHLLGAAGVVEAIFSVLAIRDQVAPPTINLENPGEGCDLDYVPNTARRMKIDAVASNSFGFGGTNGTLIFRALR